MWSTRSGKNVNEGGVTTNWIITKRNKRYSTQNIIDKVIKYRVEKYTMPVI